MEKIYHPNNKKIYLCLFHTKQTSEQGKLSGIKRELHNDKGVNFQKRCNSAECVYASKRASKYLRQNC